MRLSFVYLVFGLSVLVHAAPLEEEDSNTLLNGLLSMLSTDDKEPTLVTADSDSDDMDWLDNPPAMVTPVTTGKPSSTTRSPVPVSSGPASVATPQPMSTSISTSTPLPISLPKAATTSPTSVYDEISSDTHPFSRLPKDVRHSLSDMLIKFNATIQPMLDELTANINIKLEEALQDPLQKSLNNVVNEFTMQVINGKRRGALQGAREDVDKMQGRAGQLLINMSTQKGLTDLLGNITQTVSTLFSRLSRTPVMWATTRNLSDDLKKSVKTIQEQIRQEVPPDEWLPKLRRKLARTLRLNTAARLMLMRREIDTRFEEQFLNRMAKELQGDTDEVNAARRYMKDVVHSTVVPNLDKIINDMLTKINTTLKGKRNKAADKTARKEP